MKKIEAVVRLEKFRAVKDALEDAGFPGEAGRDKAPVEGREGVPCGPGPEG